MDTTTASTVPIPKTDPSRWSLDQPPENPTLLFFFGSEAADVAAASRSVYRALLAQQEQCHPHLDVMCFDVYEQRGTLDKILQKYDVRAVPTVLGFPARAEQPLGRVEGAYPARVGALAEQITSGTPPMESVSVQERIRRMIEENQVLLFMKGTPDRPRCGFSQQIVQLLLEELELPRSRLATFDVLSDEAIRQGLKEYSQWPTFPQLYIRGELIGGLDVCREMARSGELAELLAATPETEH
ncbi:hypothetical protein CCYA_CCYA03G1100 [Cyanidiococcus yangmingshanensis]|nr:hypothetical protein CCYA_CCYA03G1100 [Cyanidiococcus yangmingshanensis]